MRQRLLLENDRLTVGPGIAAGDLRFVPLVNLSNSDRRIRFAKPLSEKSGFSFSRGCRNNAKRLQAIFIGILESRLKENRRITYRHLSPDESRKRPGCLRFTRLRASTAGVETSFGYQSHWRFPVRTGSGAQNDPCRKRSDCKYRVHIRTRGCSTGAAASLALPRPGGGRDYEADVFPREQKIS
jgi:hypothetical protein